MENSSAENNRVNVDETIPLAPTAKASDTKYPYRPSVPLAIPKPNIPHISLTEKDIGDRPVIVIGDVHGCLEELKELVDKVHSSHPNCLFLLCGDIVNKGPYSLDTLRYVRSLGQSKALTVRGNHEDHVIDRWMKWQSSPNKELVPEGKFAWSVTLEENDIKWLSDLPYTIFVPHLQALVVHAGILPGVDLDKQDSWDMTEMRDFVRAETGELVASKLRLGKPWAIVWDSEKRFAHVYFGHDARRRLQAYSQATGLDTGCVFGGQLTARFLTGDRAMISVDAKKIYKMKDSE